MAAPIIPALFLNLATLIFTSVFKYCLNLSYFLLIPPPKIIKLGENIVLMYCSKISKRKAHSSNVNSSFFLMESAQKNSIISPSLCSNFPISKLGINFPL